MSSDEDAARKYLSEHGVENAITAVVSQIILDRPGDPLTAMGKMLQSRSTSALKMVTWNIAAVNNNPFEYWLTHPDPAYDQLMQDVQNFIEEPGAADVPVGEVFTQAMFDELDALMTAQGWDAADLCRTEYGALAQRKIISGFMKDSEMGNKRLMSMPDRMTNMIDLSGGGAAYRPTVISSYSGDMATVDAWWTQWKDVRSSPAIKPRVSLPAHIPYILTPRLCACVLACARVALLLAVPLHQEARRARQEGRRLERQAPMHAPRQDPPREVPRADGGGGDDVPPAADGLPRDLRRDPRAHAQ